MPTVPVVKKLNNTMKTFSQYLAEAGIRRKLRVLQSVETDPGSTRGERVSARQDVAREQARRTGRVISRAKTEAESSEPLPTIGGTGILHAHAERLERVGQKTYGYAAQMADVEKPGFVRARERRTLAPRGNDGY